MEDHGDRTSEFFRIVFEPVSQGVRLPTLFMQNHGRSLKANTAVTLKLPTGASWSIRLRQTDTGLWLGRGWEEFAEYYAVEVCNLLLFKYNGSTQFSVIIMDSSGSEIEYPVDGDDGDDEEMPDFDENIGTIREGEKKRFNSYVKAVAFKSENPFVLSFMQPSYVTDRFILWLNPSSLKDFLPRDPNSTRCTLQVRVPGRNKVWTMYWNVYSEAGKTTVSKGWKGFVLDNKLCVADVCVFELVNPPHLLFNATIFRRC